MFNPGMPRSMMRLRRQGLHEEKQRLYLAMGELSQRIKDAYDQMKVVRERSKRDELWRNIQVLKEHRKEVYGRLQQVKSEIQAINFALRPLGAPPPRY